ncbi:MAG TPA: hypothetical protein VIT45_12410 [Allosphingosinicella sp.]
MRTSCLIRHGAFGRWSAVFTCMTGLLAACASMPSGRPPDIDLIVEGREESYPAFEAAAKACGFTTMELFTEYVTDPRGRSHFNLYKVYPLNRESRCVLQWVDDNPQAGLVLMGH